jgi:sterol desaturase/sphingolipid hydroxylase (fatty acid hydroxylase superfamily)
MHILAGLFGHQTAQLIVIFGSFGFMGLEYLLSRLVHHEDTHDLAESASSLSIAVGRHFIHAFEAGLVALPFAFAYEHRLFQFSSTSALALVALFFATEFAYYWQHRLSHQIRWMWATHAVHHSPTKMNMTAAVRLGWTGNISGNFLFFLPLVLIGFYPFMVIGMLGLNLFYQFFIHTELLRSLGPLEWVLNTPAHHRVHHASNPSCLDKNFGGIVIIFDRLFGTFAEAPKDEALSYGVAGGARTLNPVRIIFGEWVAIAHDIAAAPSLSTKLRALIAAPNAPEAPSGKGAMRAAIETSAVTLIYPGE